MAIDYTRKSFAELIGIINNLNARIEALEKELKSTKTKMEMENTAPATLYARMYRILQSYEVQADGSLTYSATAKKLGRPRKFILPTYSEEDNKG